MSDPEPTQGAERAQLALWATFGLIATLYLAHTKAYLFLNDDAFISFRYADHWARTGELVYNLGERVEGYTNFLWVALLSLIARLGGDIPTWGLWLGPLFGLLNLTGAMWLAQRLTPRPPPRPSVAHPTRALPRLASLLAGVTLATSPSFTCWSSGGLEVQLFTLLLTLTLILSLRAWSERRSGLGALAGLTSALMTMTRPEGLMFMGLLGLWRLKRVVTETRSPRREEWLWVGVFLGVYLPYWLWRWRYYGHPLPNTYYVKTGAEGLWSPGGRYLLSWLRAEPWLALWIAPLVAWLYSARARLLHPPALDEQGACDPEARQLTGFTVVSALWLLGLTLHVARVGGDFMANHRFLVPMMPICASVLSAQLVTLLTRQMRRSCWVVLVGTLCLGCALGSMAIERHTRAMRVGSDQGVDSIGWLRQFVVQCEHIGRWINMNTPPETRIATTAAGAIAYYSRRPTLDLLGLNDEWVAHNVPAKGARPGHTKSAPLSYVLRWGVDLLIYHPVISAQRPKAHRGFERALKPRGYTWRVFEPPLLTPPYWGVWVKRGLKLPSGPALPPPTSHPATPNEVSAP